MSPVMLSLNGRSVELEVPPLRRLTDVLRDDLGLTATKVGCEAGDCGACSVLLDGALVNACTLPIGRLGGHEVVTLEGLDASGRIDRLQRSFLHHGAAQCGICTPGMLVAAAALLAVNPAPDEQAVKNGLGGVLCRCTGYRKIIDAVVAAHAFDEEPVGAPEGKAVGQRVPRVDGMPKVRGTDIFGADGVPSDALVARVIRSPYPRAAFSFGDLDDYVDSHPGVVAVFTATHIPGRNYFGVISATADQPVFAEGEARYRGEAVALVVGEADTMDDLDLAALPIEWHELPALMTPAAAMVDGADLIHPGRPQNLLIRGLVQQGDLEAGFAQADMVVEGEFSTGFIEHAYIEPEAGFARRVGDRVEVHVTTQTPHMDLIEVAEILDLDPSQVRIVPTAVGGGFGGKLDLSIQPFLALAAWRLDRPVRMTYTRPGSMMSTIKRHPSSMRVRIGATADGKLTAMDFDASRQTFISGNAAFAAGQTLRRRMLDLVGASAEASFEFDGSTLSVHDRGEVKGLDLTSLPAGDLGLVAVAEATYDPPTTPLDENGQGEPYAVFGFGAQLTELEVDLELGTVKLLRITAAHDVGRAVNPTLVEGQIEGGIAQGIGMALMEEYIPGRTDNLHDYLIPTIGDVPEVVSILVESNDPRGPYGAKGIGEHSLIATAPSILNAIRDAIGVAIRTVPATPDRVLAAIRSAQRFDDVPGDQR